MGKVPLWLCRNCFPNGTSYSGKVLYKGTDLVPLSDKEMENYRGTEIANIFQEPMTSLNPVMKIGEQIAEAISVREHRTSIYDSTRSDSTSSAPMGAKNRLFLPDLKSYCDLAKKETYTSVARKK